MAFDHVPLGEVVNRVRFAVRAVASQLPLSGVVFKILRACFDGSVRRPGC